MATSRRAAIITLAAFASGSDAQLLRGVFVSSSSSSWERGADGRMHREMHKESSEMVRDGEGMKETHSILDCMHGLCREMVHVSDPNQAPNFIPRFVRRILDRLRSAGRDAEDGRNGINVQAGRDGEDGQNGVNVPTEEMTPFLPFFGRDARNGQHHIAQPQIEIDLPLLDGMAPQGPPPPFFIRSEGGRPEMEIDIPMFEAPGFGGRGAPPLPFRPFRDAPPERMPEMPAPFWMRSNEPVPVAAVDPAPFWTRAENQPVVVEVDGPVAPPSFLGVSTPSRPMHGHLMTDIAPFAALALLSLAAFSVAVASCKCLRVQSRELPLTVALGQPLAPAAQETHVAAPQVEAPAKFEEPVVPEVPQMPQEAALVASYLLQIYARAAATA